MSNTCHTGREWYFKGLTFHIWKGVVFQGIEIPLSSKYGNMKVPARHRLACVNVDISMELKCTKN